MTFALGALAIFGTGFIACILGDRTPAADRCHVRGCGRPGPWPVTRRDGTTARVCAGCRDEGTANGWWTW